jgi:hypothetical protein
LGRAEVARVSAKALRAARRFLAVSQPLRRPVEGEHSSIRGDSKQRIRQVPRKCDSSKSSPYARESYRPRAGDGRHNATPIRVPRSARLLCPSLTTQPRRECLQDLPVFRLDERETRIHNPEI